MARKRVQGAAKVSRALRQLPTEITDGVRKAIHDAGMAVYGDALKLAPKPGSNPYSTGDLHRMLEMRVARSGLSARVGSWGVPRAYHIHLVEFGTKPHDIPMPDGSVRHHPGAPAQPFLFPAYRENKNWAIDEVRKAVLAALTKAQATIDRPGD